MTNVMKLYLISPILSKYTKSTAKTNDSITFAAIRKFINQQEWM